MKEICHSRGFSPKLLEKIKLYFKDCKTIAVKIHFGEPGNKTAFTPDQIKLFTESLKTSEKDYFLYDSSVAYPGRRSNPKDHKAYAIEKGWGKLGEIRTDDDSVLVKGKSVDYEVCKPLTEVDGVLVISHLKGHVCSGFGGAIKHLGMGCLTKKTKGDIHAGGEPLLIGECKQCGVCVDACPINGIILNDKPEFKLCYGCSNCVVACPHNVLKVKLEEFDILLAEGATAAASQFKKAYYVNIMKNITQKCDCESNSGEIIAEDAGYICGEDPVSVDKASFDIIVKKEGKDVFFEHNKKSPLLHIEAAEERGLGNTKYDLNLI